MTRECLSVEDLKALAEAAESDRRREHLSRCPRCRALWIAYQEFMNPPSAAADDADLHRAEKALARFLDTEVVGVASHPEPRPPGESPLRRVIARLTQPAARRAWVGATAVLVAIIAAGVLRPHHDSRSVGLLRGVPAGEGGGVVVPVLYRAAIGSDGSLEFAWAPVPGARNYEIRLFASDLTPVAALDAGTDTTMRVEPTRLPVDLEPGTLLLWRVAAQTGEGAPALSSVSVIRLP